jgi:hypothetical protein
VSIATFLNLLCMKKWFLLLIAPLLALVLCLSSCSNDDDDDPLSGFDYSAETLYGTWKITKYKDITWPFQTTTATFRSDGTYTGRGYFGNGTGTYKASGKTIRCYIDGDLYCRYDVISLSGTTAVLDMQLGSSSTTLRITCKKQ